MGKRREPPADDEALTDTQRKILTAALEVFSDRGFAGASTATIASRAGVAEKTLFAQFKTKAELLTRTLRPSVFLLIEPRVFDRVREAVKTEGKSLDDVLRALMRDRVDLASKHPKKLKLIAHELLLRPELLGNIGREFQTSLVPIVLSSVTHLASRGELRTDIPLKTILRTVVCVTAGYAIIRHVLGLEKDNDDDTEIDRIVSILVDGLRPQRQ
jgi:AcrR family transcriptional regulator